LTTVWIPQVVNAPVVNATNTMCILAVVSAVFGLIAVGFTVWTSEKKGRTQIQIQVEAAG